MERTIKKETKTPDHEGEVKWKKAGGGSFKLRNRFIKPGETFYARPDEIPGAFRDTVIQVSGEPAPIRTSKKISDVKKPVFTAVPHGKSKSQWDVIDEKGKLMNTKVLTKEKAESFVKDLNG